MNIDELNEEFGIEGELSVIELQGDFPFVSITNKFAEADICLYGAHLTAFRPQSTTDVIWMSPYAVFEEGKAIRGGIPVCFPWFGSHKNDESKPQHGFARTMMWELLETKSINKGETSVRMRLCSNEATKAFWPYDFCAEMHFIIGAQLSVTLKVTNTAEKELNYTAALHSYFNLSGIENIAIGGLENTEYENQLDGNRYVQKENLLKISKATTRHYFDTQSDCIINDPYFNRNIRVAKKGSKCSTVWNPWAETCAEMGDMPNNGYETFVCLETVNKINDEIKLGAGEHHETTTVISIE